MPTEQDPLLQDRDESQELDIRVLDEYPTSPSSRIHPYYIAVVAFLARLCFFISTTTSVEILLELVCRLYWHSHNTYSPLPGDRCAHPSVRRYFTMLQSLVVIMEGLGGLFMYGPMSRLSGKYGRRSMLTALTVILILGTLCLIGASRLPVVFTAPLLLSSLILTSITGSWQFDLMTVMYVVDTTTAQERTSRLSFVLGCAYASGIPGFAFGGALTAYLRSNTAVYWVVISISLILLAYIRFILPESFDSTRRAKLQEEWQREQAQLGSSYIRSSLDSFFRPLLLLKPHRNPITGVWKLRLLYCGIHAFFSGLASGYLWTAVIVYLALHLQYGPDDNGYVLTAGAISTGISLVVLTPLAIKSLSPFYGKTSISANEIESPNLADPNSGSSKMDKHLAIFGWTLDIVAVALLSLAQTRVEVFICVAALGASYFRISAFRSVVAASGDPIRSGEILAAIQTITSCGNAISGLVLGSVLTASINTFPNLVFLVYSAIASVSVVALCLIRESDRYIPTFMSA
ncbi:MFS general substrate transporter [Mycena sanguinolenta]|uniref:MFS general substrate transporter n=1 Tax=Mycena sanguinolenta TaxID=230812 RepID=A0A8H6YG05_9AGAR|nr:MFS general substrate transporter [Mycena sanguinolenta]